MDLLEARWKLAELAFERHDDDAAALKLMGELLALAGVGPVVQGEQVAPVALRFDRAGFLGESTRTAGKVAEVSAPISTASEPIATAPTSMSAAPTSMSAAPISMSTSPLPELTAALPPLAAPPPSRSVTPAPGPPAKRGAGGYPELTGNQRQLLVTLQGLLRAGNSPSGNKLVLAAGLPVGSGYKALDQLKAAGLIHDERPEARGGAYVLTSPGRVVVREMAESAG